MYEYRRVSSLRLTTLPWHMVSSYQRNHTHSLGSHSIVFVPLRANSSAYLVALDVRLSGSAGTAE